jgi:hypothetical protein
MLKLLPDGLGASCSALLGGGLAHTSDCLVRPCTTRTPAIFVDFRTKLLAERCHSVVPPLCGTGILKETVNDGSFRGPRDIREVAAPVDLVLPFENEKQLRDEPPKLADLSFAEAVEIASGGVPDPCEIRMG